MKDGPSATVIYQLICLCGQLALWIIGTVTWIQVLSYWPLMNTSAMYWIPIAYVQLCWIVRVANDHFGSVSMRFNELKRAGLFMSAGVLSIAVEAAFYYGWDIFPGKVNTAVFLVLLTSVPTYIATRLARAADRNLCYWGNIWGMSGQKYRPFLWLSAVRELVRGI